MIDAQTLVGQCRVLARVKTRGCASWSPRQDLGEGRRAPRVLFSFEGHGGVLLGAADLDSPVSRQGVDGESHDEGRSKHHGAQEWIRRGITQPRFLKTVLIGLLYIVHIVRLCAQADGSMI